MICNGTNDASINAVSCHVDPALPRRGIIRVDVVPRSGIGVHWHMDDLVSEESGGGDVLAVEEGRGKEGGFWV